MFSPASICVFGSQHLDTKKDLKMRCLTYAPSDMAES
jgi:hypothetical protein